MRVTRRRFLKTAAAACTLVGGGPLSPGYRLPVGVCTSTKNAGLLKEADASYLEAGVRWFLVPDKGEEAFAENLEQGKACGLPIVAANGFLPGSLKSTGPEANHEGVLAFAETAFERAKRAGIRYIVFGSSGSRRVPDGFDHRKAELQYIPN